jgi:hypothetical protein
MLKKYFMVILTTCFLVFGGQTVLANDEPTIIWDVVQYGNHVEAKKHLTEVMKPLNAEEREIFGQSLMELYNCLLTLGYQDYQVPEIVNGRTARELLEMKDACYSRLQ